MINSSESRPYPVLARLRAIVAVSPSERIRCQQPGCKRSVYAAIHVVDEGGVLMVLGTTCFAIRYGTLSALGDAQFGGGGGRLLTETERQLLEQNTAALLAKFEAEDRKWSRAVGDDARPIDEGLIGAAEVGHIRRDPEAVGCAEVSTRYPKCDSPWPWQLPGTSIALMAAPHGQHWVRVQHIDRSHRLVPWPSFEDWDEALPEGVGRPDFDLTGFVVVDIVYALQILQQSGFSKPVVGRWQDMLPWYQRGLL